MESLPIAAGLAYLFFCGKVGSDPVNHGMTTGDVRANVGWNEHGIAAAGEPGVSTSCGVRG